MRFLRSLTVAAAVALGGASMAIGTSPTSSHAASPASTAVRDAHHDTSAPLRDIVSRSTAGSAGLAGGATPTTAIQAAGPTIQSSTGLTFVQNFDGIATPSGTTSTWASDADGDVGHDHYMEATNFSAAIYTKTGALVLGPFSTANFWDDFDAPCGGGWTDVIVLYDQAADRWFVSRFARENSVSPLNWYQCFAISQTSDPTGSYYRYAFLIDAEEFNDYPKFGIWPDAYYMTADRDKIFPGTGNFVAAFEREKMLTGASAQSIVMKLDNNGNRAGMLPADWDGDTPPPAGSPGYFVKTLDTNTGWPEDALEIWQLDVDWALGTGNLSVHATLDPADFDSAVCDLDQDCIPQPDTTNGLDPLAGGRPMFRLAYRNFGDHEAMVFNHTVEAAEDQAAVRWYELRKSGADPWSIYQQQTFAPDENHYWIGSVAMDRAGNAALVYNVSGTDVYPSIRVAARLAGDPLNSIEEQATIHAGSGSQTGFVFWADYSSLTLDPADDCTFWSAATYQPVTSDLQTWATRISAFRLPDCVTDLEITKSASPPGPITAGTDVTWSIDVTNNGPRGAGNVSVTDDVPAGTSFVSISAPGWSCTTPPIGDFGAIGCGRDELADGASSTIAVVATVDCSTPNGTLIMNTTTIGAETPPDSDLDNNSATAGFTVHNPVPVVIASVLLDMIPQNNHELVNVGLAASATDGACPDPAVVVNVYGNEDDETPTAPGTVFSPDATGLAPGTLRLRSERVSTGDGRVYLIVVTATDEAGGTGFATLTVTVPKSSAAKSIASVTALASAAKAFADANGGAAPPGYFVIGDGPIIGPKQ
ncbi:MAG TPA: DUF11 domain-containing protein [Candidatus Limnocylindrales bacterium]|nr:DUF11 domain-containing protein [Candidatus Limnocylindrales bacterium]